MIINILLIVAAIVVLAVIALLVVVAWQPSELRVSRSARIAAPASEAFTQVNDFRNWSAWSPYQKRDPAMKKTYAGAEQGTGAIYSWNGNNEVGEGRSTIVECRENELIRIKLEFLRPFKCISTAEFTFQPQGRESVVTWSLLGKNSFMGKAMSLVMNMDKMIGGDFEKGLADLKAVVEGAFQEQSLAGAGAPRR
jgi:hypothetical protein